MTAIVVNRRVSDFDEYIGRGSEWGNDYSHLYSTKARIIVGSREEAVAYYERDLAERVRREGLPLIQKLAALDGKRLGCYCAPQACHGDVLVKAAAWAAELLRSGGTPDSARADRPS